MTMVKKLLLLAMIFSITPGIGVRMMFGQEFPCRVPDGIIRLYGGNAPMFAQGAEGEGYVRIYPNAGKSNKSSVGLVDQGFNCIKAIKSWSVFFSNMEIGMIIPIQGRLYYLRTLIEHKNAKLDEAILEALSVAETEKLGVNPPASSVVLPLQGTCNLMIIPEDISALNVRKFTPATATQKAVVNILVDLPPEGFRTKVPPYQPFQQDFREGDVIPSPLLVTELRVHRIVAPDPAKHIPGWVELRFEPKDKPAPDKPVNDQPTSAEG